MMIVKDLFPWWSLCACIFISLFTFIMAILAIKDKELIGYLILLIFLCGIFWLNFYQDVKCHKQIIEVSDELISAHDLLNKYEILGDYPEMEDWYIARRR